MANDGQDGERHICPAVDLMQTGAVGIVPALSKPQLGTVNRLTGHTPLLSPPQRSQLGKSTRDHCKYLARRGLLPFGALP